MMPPVVSVILPVRDAEETLAEALDSLQAQTLADHEVVAVDDHSTDASRDLLLSRAARDPRLRVVPCAGRGLVAALNSALAQARAPMVARMDADDLAHPDRLREQAERLEGDPSVDVLGCRVRHLGQGPGSLGMARYVDWQNSLLSHDDIVRDLFVESPLVHPSVALRTETLRGLGGWRAFDGPEDYDLWLRAHASGLRFAKLPSVLLDWRDHPRRLTRRDTRYAPARFQSLKLDWLERLLLLDRGVVVWGAGPVGKAWSRALRARGHALVAFVEVDPRKIGQLIHGAPVLDVARARAHAEALHLGAVGRSEARPRLRAAAETLGLLAAGRFLAVA